MTFETRTPGDTMSTTSIIEGGKRGFARAVVSDALSGPGDELGTLYIPLAATLFARLERLIDTSGLLLILASDLL